MQAEKTSKQIIAFGGGVDSSALLAINLKRDQAAALIGISREVLDQAFPVADAVMFSDTGAERSATYANVARFEEAYRAAGIAFHRVRREQETITEWLLRTGTIPLMPGGSHLCSLKFKTAVMHGKAEQLFPGSQITWSIGIEANEDRRANKSFTVRTNDTHLSAYPLRNLGLDRKACEAIIVALGFPAVVKSSCVFCPFMQPAEIAEVIKTEPEAWDLVKRIEKNFQETSPRKHGAWIAAGKPVNSAGKALRGMWRMDSWAQGARLFAKRVNGKQLSATEWEALINE
jgi:hypothetical protein